MGRIGFAIGCVIALAASSAMAQDSIELNQLQAKLDDAGSMHVEVGVSVTSTAPKTVGMVSVQCSALDRNGNLADTGIAQIYNLKAGETAYEFVPLLDISDTNYKISCRVSSVLD